MRLLSLACMKITGLMMALANGALEVSSPVYCHGVHVEDDGHALISDNWFDLLPGVAVRLETVDQTALNAAAFTAVIGIPRVNAQ